MKGGMTFERPHIRRKQAEADCATAVAVVDTIDQGRKPLTPVIVGSEQIGLVLAGGNQVEQHDADTERLVMRYSLPELLKAAKEKAGVAHFVKIGFVPPAAEIATQERCTPNRRQ
jgi:hypothetical protein